MRDQVILPELQIWIGKSGSKEEREAVVLKAVTITAKQIKRKE